MHLVIGEGSLPATSSPAISGGHFDMKFGAASAGAPPIAAATGERSAAVCAQSFE